MRNLYRRRPRTYLKSKFDKDHAAVIINQRLDMNFTKTLKY